VGGSIKLTEIEAYYQLEREDEEIREAERKKKGNNPTDEDGKSKTFNTT